MNSKSVGTRIQNPSSSLGESFACHFIQKTKRSAWKALNNLKIELFKVYNSNLDSEVKNKKLIWWTEELQRLKTNKPNHPLTQLVARDTSPFLNSFEDYSPILNSWVELINHSKFEWLNQNDFIHYCKFISGDFELLKAQILLGREPLHQLKEFILQSNQAHIQINLLRDFGYLVRSQHLPVALSDLNSLDLVSQEVLAWRNEKLANNWETLAKKLATNAQESIHKAQQWIAPLPKFEKQSLWINQALLRLDIALLEEIKKSNYQVLSQFIDLTPLRTIAVILKSKFSQS